MNRSAINYEIEKLEQELVDTTSESQKVYLSQKLALLNQMIEMVK